MKIHWISPLVPHPFVPRFQDARVQLTLRLVEVLSYLEGLLSSPGRTLFIPGMLKPIKDICPTLSRALS
ncbi:MULTISPECIES: hypothetical protein [Metallosphaera]|uniref:hypothetical protein n=1 Tax=Metallosphaera TaxID=41980 RepID=UPI00130E4B56|nr:MULTISPECIES: hypothetical protein [Metallosphaera]MCY0861428.1 hypothetical protein [Metallosphaera prunae]